MACKNVSTEPLVRVSKLSHLFPMHPFSAIWKRQKTLCFQGVEKGCIGNEWVKLKKSKAFWRYEQYIDWISRKVNFHKKACTGG